MPVFIRFEQFYVVTTRVVKYWMVYTCLMQGGAPYDNDRKHLCTRPRITWRGGTERYGGDVFNVLWSVFSRLLSERNINDVIFRYA